MKRKTAETFRLRIYIKLSRSIPFAKSNIWLKIPSSKTFCEMQMSLRCNGLLIFGTWGILLMEEIRLTTWDV